ncbi:HeH/LEM domain-containing protein [Virgibacillus halodenitrificans]|uniref:HeH/LEM domain-containing protein n=1 Tax=Virgibacillus halodenitrificans TaxID=1482 RepID=UPI001FB4C699|nr:HeH/LEM domain-containing protein [Virgibacillus halodenitrificans]MCJ0932927.1 HeH/LEM domain-containing protein [Virgibacillus halodenitrificans]
MTNKKIVVADGKGNKRIVQPMIIPSGFKYVEDYTESEKDYSKLPQSKLRKVKNDELKGYLDEKGVEYNSDAKKEDLINLIVGE